MKPTADFSRLTEIMAALRDRQSGCPWDLEQDFDSIRSYTIEEAYEVADAIERKDYEDLKGELGDLLLQPVYHAQMAAEAGLFDIADVILSINEKLVRRHPHVFGDPDELSANGVKEQWDDIKSLERNDRAARRGQAERPSLLDDVPRALPALLRAEKLAKRAAKVGFDWPDMAAVTMKVHEELDEISGAAASGDMEALHEEIGDLLFSVVNLARKAGVSPETALADANAKFVRRFDHVEKRCAQDGTSPAEADLETLDRYWNEVRAADKSRS